jgi:hypothetical protein
MTRHFARKFQTLSVVAMFVACIGALTVVAAPAIAQNPVPFVDQPLVPDATAPGGPAFTLTVNGAGFVAASVVNWNGTPRATTFVSRSKLTAAILASDIATASTAAVTVVNPSPGGGVSNTLHFSIAVAEASASFQPVELYDSGKYINYSSVAIADLNGDGKPDLVVTSQNMSSTGDGSVEVFLGNGDGTFQAALAYDSGGNSPNSLAIADVNGDGKLDIVVGNEGNGNTSGGVGVLLGNGDGTFQNVSVVSTSYAPGVVVADVNGDGKPDVIIATCCQDYFAGAAEVLLGKGDGTFQPPVFYSSGGSGASWASSSIALADLRGDGKLDLLVANYCGNNLYCPRGPGSEGSVGVLLGNGDGTFQPAVAYDSGDIGATSVAVADVNGDGKPDLLVGHCGYNGCGNETGVVGVLLGNGDGTFQPPSTYNGGDSISSMAVADVNMDGKLDIVVANMYPLTAGPDGSVSVLLGNGGGTFQLPLTSDAGAPWSVAVAVADVNGDGKPDAVVVNECDSWCFPGAISSSVGILLNSTGSVETSTITTVSSSLNPSIYGQTVTFTAAVSSASGLPTGTVIFYDGSTAIGSATLVNRSTSISVSTLAAGSQPITAVYQGCSAFGLSTSAPLNQVVHSVATTAAVISSPNPARVEQRVTYTATVATQYGGKATGTVTFQDSGVTIATVALSNNKAAHSTSYPTIGIHSITASYSGDLNNVGSTSPALTEDIDGATKTVVTTSGSPSFVGQPVTFTATVTSVYGAIPNGETVTFYDATTVMGTGTTVGGVATFTTSSLTAKTHTIKATYSGDATFVPSSGTVTQVVNKYTTTTALVSSLNPSNYGQRVTLTATVTWAGPTPTGTVTFRNGSVILGSVALNTSGVASLTTAKIPVGVNTLTATYNGDAFNGKSVSAAITQTVSQASISMVLTSTPNPSAFGISVKFTAKLTSNGGLPSGQPVTFSYNGATLGTANVNSTGVATFYTTAALPRGSDVVTAAYAGTVDYSSASATVTQVVN